MANLRYAAYTTRILDDLTGARIALCTTTPTASDTGTALAAGGGYTAGGPLADFAAESPAGTRVGPQTEITLTNSSGVAWVIEGAVIHDAGAAHPTTANAMYFIATGTVTINDGETLSIAANAFTITEA
jgi:hypothetical protein